MNKNNFDFLRFFFASIVVLRHIIDLSENYSLKLFKPFFDSYSPVTGFFIISGYLIGRSYITTSTLSDYFRKRAKRLIPAYMISVISGGILLSFFSSYSFQEYFMNKQFYTYLLSNIIFLNFLQPCLPGVFNDNPECAVNGALWTIKVEILFYIMVPLIVFVLNKNKNKFVLLIAIYFSSILYKFYLGSSLNDTFVVLSRQTPGFLSYFLSGLSFFYYYDFYMNNKNKLFYISVPIFIFEYYYGLEIFRPMSFSLIIFYIAHSFPKLNNFGKYGDFSYGIYIFHFPIIQLFVKYNFFNLYNPFVMTVVVTFLVGIIAVLSWNIIEKPFLRRGSVSQIML